MTLPFSLGVRVLLVLAAVGMVVAFGLALLLSPTISLGQAIATVNHTTLVGMQDFVQNQAPAWVWTMIMLPILARPSWLLPLAAALLCGGVAFSLATRAPPSRSHRRRG